MQDLVGGGLLDRFVHRIQDRNYSQDHKYLSKQPWDLAKDRKVQLCKTKKVALLAYMPQEFPHSKVSLVKPESDWTTSTAKPDETARAQMFPCRSARLTRPAQ